jgi:hypothetical protein
MQTRQVVIKVIPFNQLKHDIGQLSSLKEADFGSLFINLGVLSLLVCSILTVLK